MRNILICVVSIFVAAGAIFGYTYLVFSTSGFLSEIATIREQVSTAGQREAIQNAQEKFIEETKVERDEAETFISRDNDIVHVIETIEAAGRREKVQVSIGSVVVAPLGERKHLELVRITLSARGAFPSLGAFTTALEVFPVASRLEKVELEASTNNLWFGTYTFLLVKEKPI